MWSYVLKKINIETVLAFYIVLFCHSAMLNNSYIIQFPLPHFARMCENLLVSGLLDKNVIRIDSPYTVQCTVHCTQDGEKVGNLYEFLTQACKMSSTLEPKP